MTEATTGGSNTPDPDNAPGKVVFPSGFLQDPLAERKDIAMLSNILKRRRFALSDDIKAECINRLCRIAEKEFVDVMTREGPQALDGPADITAVAAIRVLAQFESMNQKDEFKLIDVELKKNEAPAGDTYNIGCVGSIALGQEPISPDDAKRQAQEILGRVHARIGQGSPPAGEKVVIDVTPEPQKPSGLEAL
jgi:hypothetical protein